MASPIIGLVFEHGQFTSAAADVAVQALRYYLVGLPFAALDLLLIYAFYARQDTRTPALIGFGSLLIYLVVTIVLLPTFGLYSLMIADSVKHIVHASVSAFILYRHLGGMGEQRLLRTLAQTTAAAMLMGLVLSWIDPLLEGWLGASSLLREIAVVMAGSVLSVAIFIGAALLLRIEELRWLVALFRARLSK
jgi:putative peptidoglycan lipid II flippase